jgi:hypothetical protein
VWTDVIKIGVFNGINTRVVKQFKSKYPNINCSTTQKTTTSPKFPYVQITKLEGVEQGATFDKDTINAVLSTFQIDVFSNDGEEVCEEISSYICEVMTGKLRFTMVGEPIANYENEDVCRYTARYRRLFAYNDKMTW